jgi:nucleoside-diphosphate-sugar epimerase
MRVLVTGASGFIGKTLINKLDEDGHQVLALSRSIESKKKKNILWLQCDLSLPNTYSNQVKDFLPEVLIHLAWQDIPNFSLEKSKFNLDQALNFISLIVDLDCCQKIILSGSCFELNQLQGQCLETSMGEAKDHFTWAKNSLYSWLRMMSMEKDFELMWMRIFYAYGPGQRSASLIPSILDNLKKGKLPEILTPKNANDFIFIDDVVNALSKAILVNNASMIYNLGSGSSSTILQICRIAEKIVLGSSKLTDEIERVSLDTNSNIDFWADTTHSKKYLDWHPKVTLDDGIKKTWDWLNLK